MVGLLSHLTGMHPKEYDPTTFLGVDAGELALLQPPGLGVETTTIAPTNPGFDQTPAAEEWPSLRSF